MKTGLIGEVNQVVLVFGGYDMCAWQISYFASSSNDVYDTEEEAIEVLINDGFEFLGYCRSAPGNKGQLWYLPIKD
jgi:hypothetical protein